MTTQPDDAAVTLDDVIVTRGKNEVLHHLTFQVPRGQITGLLGPSGCGKTTLMRSIVGVQAGVTGNVTVLGKPAGDAALRRRVGYVTQAASVYDDLTVEENLLFFARVLGASAADVDEAVHAVALDDFRGRLVRDMSGGQRSRVSLAVSLMTKPELLVLDEPTVGLDPVLRRDLWTLFTDLAQRGITLLVSSHVMDEAEHCDRLILMRAGVIVADETPSSLKARTRANTVENAFLEIVR